MSVGLLLRERTTRCSVTFSLSLSCARRTNDAHTFTNNTFYYHETTTLVKIIQRKSKRKKLGNARKPRKRPRNARTTREPPRKAQGRFGWRKVYTLLLFFFLRGFFDDDFSSSSRFGRTETRKRDGDQVSEREERLDELSDRN